MKAIKTTIGILASVLAINAIAQSDDSVSATMGAGQSITTNGTWVNQDGYPTLMDSKIGANNVLINQELAKRDSLLTSQSKLITDLQNQLNALKTAGTGGGNATCDGAPSGTVQARSIGRISRDTYKMQDYTCVNGIWVGGAIYFQ
jgi:hypothetical protein